MPKSGAYSKILRREQLELLNLGPLRSAIEGDPDFVSKVATNVRALQKEGLIQFAAADTFSGEATYKALIESGAFATLNINFNIADDAPEREAFPLAGKRNMRVVVREAFIKGVLFMLGREAGLHDEALLARAAMKWIGSRPGVDTVIVGADTEQHLRDNVNALEHPVLDDAERGALEKLQTHPSFAALKQQKGEEFVGGTAIGQRAKL